MVANGRVDVVLLVFVPCVVFGLGSGDSCTYSNCSCFKRRALGVAPSISSRFFSLLRKPSTDRNKECTVGVLSLKSPCALALCFAPIAACSCFSTATICFFSSYISFVGAFVGWVSQEFNYSTISSTPHRRSTTTSTLLWISSIVFVISGVSTTYFDLVAL
jgi:hypothetical protein